MQDNSLIINELQNVLNTPSDKLIERVNILLKDKKQLEKRNKNRIISNDKDELLKGLETVGENNLLIKKVLVEDKSELLFMGDELYKKLTNGIGVLFNNTLEKTSAVIVVSKDLNLKGVKAGKIAQDIGKFMNGGGGGKPHLATAGGKGNIKVEEILKKSKKLLVNILKG